MKSIDEMEYHPTSEKLVDILCSKTQNSNKSFFRILVAYNFSKVASMMRTNIKTFDRGVIPINLYAINLAPSGQSKGHSTNIIEEQVINKFKERYLEDTYLKISEENLYKIANSRARKKTSDPDEEFEKVQREFLQLGSIAFSFDSGTTPAVKQMRHKLLMANSGSMNMEIDEIASNLLGNIDVLNTFLELFDVGKIKQKLTKNTNENIRNEEIDGRTPTNMLLFGTPAKLLNGGKVEEEFFSILEIGYARRCLFGYTRVTDNSNELTPEEIYDILTDPSKDQFLTDMSISLGRLADSVNFNRNLYMSKDVSILLITYRQLCQKRANQLTEFEEIKKAEISHRYFKALKLAGTYAFIDGSHEVTEEHLYNAIKLVEDSGEALANLLTRERNYVKLANYIAEINKEVTHVDLVEDLPFYKGTLSQKQELMNLAIAYGYKNNIIIKKIFNDGVEFLKGESLKKVDMDKITISYGKDLAQGYKNEVVAFDQLHKLTQQNGFHWVNHHLSDGYRREDNVIPGFNLVVLDIDDGTSLDTAKLLLKDYTALYHTTKRHTATSNRFRIILPLNYNLKMNELDYKQFMKNLYEWLPFNVDTQTGQRSRKWLTCPGQYEYVMGNNLDALLFIPKTAKSEEQKKIINSQHALNNVERWFINSTDSGNRNNQLLRFALMLVDSGQDVHSVRNNVLDLNSKLPDTLPETEILSTIMQTVSKKIIMRDNNA